MRIIKSYIFLIILLFLSQGIMAWDGSGTSADPYLVKTTEDWQQIKTQPDAYFKLMQDITVTSTPAYETDYAFSGTFDGNGHTIIANIRMVNQPYMALFSYVMGATIKNLNISGNIEGGMCTAGLVGVVSNTGATLIENCYINATIKGNHERVAGFVGQANQANLTIRGCVFEGSLNGSNYGASFVGNCTSTSGITIVNCFENGTYKGFAHAGLNYNDGGSATAIATTRTFHRKNWGEGLRACSITSASEFITLSFGEQSTYYNVSNLAPCGEGITYKGIFYAKAGSAVPFTATYSSGSLGALLNSSGTLTGSGGNYSLTLGDTDASISIFELKGSGTEEEPFLIRKTADWEQMAAYVNNGQAPEGAYYKLTSDISVNNAIGTSEHPFMGYFNGDSHTISCNLYSSNAAVAPFGYIQNATIEHLKVDGNISGALHTAGLVGYVIGSPNYIKDCHVSTDIMGSMQNGMVALGGIVGHATESILYAYGCIFDGHVSAKVATDNSYAGAIVGWCNDAANIYVKDCIENGTYDRINHAAMNYTYGNPPSASAIDTRNSFSLNHEWSELKRVHKVVSVNDRLVPNFIGKDNKYPTTNMISYHSGMMVGDVFYSVKDIGVDFDADSEIEQSGAGILANNVELEYTVYYKFTMPDEDVYLSIVEPWQGTGSSADPYIVDTSDKWQQLAWEVKRGNNYAGKYFLLKNDIDIYATVGGEDHDHAFSGTFDGNGHTLTAYLKGGECTAPFKRIRNATILHLNVAGNIEGGIHSAGIAGGATENNLIEDCKVMASFMATSTHLGGFIGHANESTTTMRGCLFDGKVNSPMKGDATLYYFGAFFGWCNNSSGLTIEDCLVMPINSEFPNVEMSLVNGGNAECGTVKNAYNMPGYGYSNLGKRAFEVSTDRPVLRLDHKTTGNMLLPVTYTTSGLTSYGTGIMVADKFMAAKNETVEFQPKAHIGFAFENLRTDYGTLTLSENTYSLTLVDHNATISADISRTGVGGFSGNGTLEDPYVIANAVDWTRLCVDVAEGQTYSGKVFRMTNDIDAGNVMVGAEGKPFSGIFDGDNHTLTFNTGQEYNYVKTTAAPFLEVSGATIRHLKTKGSIFTDGKCAAGIVSKVTGNAYTRFYNCHSEMVIRTHASTDDMHGGLVGMLDNGVDSLVIDRCSFSGTMYSLGRLSIGTTTFGGFVGYSQAPLYIRYGFFDSVNTSAIATATFAQTKNSDQLKLEDCYTTIKTFIPQGTFVVGDVNVPDDVTYEFVGEPDVNINGKGYYFNGCRIKLNVPENFVFKYWKSLDGTFISDPKTAGGIHQLKDLSKIPTIVNETYYDFPEAETERTLWGVTYRYLSRRDYHYYVSNEDVQAKGWKFENDDADANLVVYNSEGKASEITAVTGYDESSFNSDGVQIHNDLVGVFRNHTHLGLIAPHAFRNSSALKTMYFKDTDANNYNTLFDFDFFIDEGAFENCQNFTELKMMQYTTRGDNHWEDIKPTQVVRVADDAFNNCPKLRISVFRDDYRDYLASATWKEHRDRFIIYEATTEDFKVNGVKYHWYRTADEQDPLKNDESGKQQMGDIVKWWNADYQQFNAASLLDTYSGNVYYASVIGVVDSEIDSEGGTMRIYNDPGSYYNYKTILLNRDAIKGNTHVKNIEFYQTNGLGDNSYSDLKMVIPNGAFQGCTNLKELRMFYYIEDGNDRFVALGPKDVIPGNNIFGVPTLQEKAVMTEQEMAACPKIPDDFRILVSPEIYPEFLEDPNWQTYLAYIEPVDYSPHGKKSDYTKDGLTYSYMTNPGGILQTSQVVSQDVSWWTAPRIAIEVALIAYQVGLRIAAVGVAPAAQQASSEAVNALGAAATNLTTAETTRDLALTASTRLIPNLGDDALFQFATNAELKRMITQGFSQWATMNINEESFQRLVELGVAQAAQDGSRKLIFERAAWTALQGESRRFFQETLRNCFGFVSNAQADLIPGFRAVWEKAAIAMNKAVKNFAYWNNLASDMSHPGRLLAKLGIQAGVTSTASIITSACWGGTGTYNAELLNKGMRENILSNIHQVGLVGGGYVITTPSKNMVYHTYIKSVDSETTDVKIYAGRDDGSWVSTRTMTFAKNAFRNNTKIKTVKFYENPDNLTSQEAMPLLLTIPDSAFVGCSNLTEFSTLLQTNGNGTRALGPENFIFAGDSIFAGLDSLKFHIVIDPTRKDDFLASESWAPLKRFFKYERAVPESEYSEYGANYAYAYENNSIKKTHKVEGHLIEHTTVIGPDDDFINDHQGAVKLCNDIGVYHNYQLDNVMASAFKGNKNIRSVSFTDLKGWLMSGDTYTGLDVTLCDSAFADCTNLANLDLLYMVTDGLPNHLDPMTPEMIKIGKGVFDNSPARLKMMPQQVAWFEKDSTWAPYKDRFMPCVIRLTDPGIKKALKPMAYYDPANTGTDDALWYDYGDLARIGGVGFSWLDGKFTAQKDNIYSFADFKWFQSVGLDYVGASWFEDCSQLGNIVLPSTIKTIQRKAFKGCSSLKEIELPQGLSAIQDNAFAGCSALNTILVRDSVPATLGTGVFDKHDGLKIYVPAPRVSSYKSAWSEYAPYIVGENTYTFSKVVTVTEVGQLAKKLGLTLKKESEMVRYIIGPYAMYDSLTVIGPLNGEDLAVLRHMAGADAYDSDPTDGQLRYLNLWDARIKKDQVNSYNGNWVDEYIGDDDIVPRYLFENCKTIEEVIFPKAATKIGENMFEEANSIKRVCIGKSTTFYDTDLLQDIDGLEELVFLTDNFCNNDSFWWDDPWEAPIGVAYTLPSQLGDYMGDTKLTRRAQTVTSPLAEETVMWALAEHGHFFPSEYLEMESAENIFNGNTAIKDFSDFCLFQNVKALESTFNGMTVLENIKLPTSIESISADAFAGCTALMEIHLSNDSVPTLAEDAFGDLPNDFKIFVPKRLCKLYREKWAQYADHINPEMSDADDEIITVTLTQPNTLAEKLGLTISLKEVTSIPNNHFYVNGVNGDYSKIRKIKVIGPISGGDLDVMRYLAGYCPWANCRNFAGRLEYIDLYDAHLIETDVAVKGYYNQPTAFFSEAMRLYYVTNNELPHHALLRAYNLKTLILPRTCTKVNERALQECEGLETLVVGDDCKDFNWNALDDDAMLTRMYLLANEKVNISTQFVVWRWLCNNYNPTFDAFYVLPSLYEEYLNDEAYTGSSWQRTNNISKGEFEDDESFQAFASHAAATADDLAQVTSVNGWFDTHTGVKDLTPLELSSVKELRTEDMQKLTKLEKVALPMSLETIGDSVFAKSPNLRYVDMLLCDSTTIVDEVRARGFAKLGIDSLRTLVYVSSDFGSSNGTNIVVANNGGFHAKKFRLVDDKEYCVPYPFKADAVENSRKLTGKNKAYAAFLPYDLTLDPAVAKVYKPTSVDGTVVTFEQVEDNSMEALKPYVIRLTGKKATLNVDEQRDIPMSSDALINADTQWQVLGYTMRGTLKRINNKEAAEMNIMMLVDGQWVDVPANNDNAYIAPFRAYLLGSVGGAGANGLSMEFIDNEATAIDTIRTVDNDGTERYYDLSGRELPGKPIKGVYIYKGKKYISK